MCFPESDKQTLVDAGIGVAFGLEVLGFFGAFFPGARALAVLSKKSKLKINIGDKYIWSAALLSAIFWHFLLGSRGFKGWCRHRSLVSHSSPCAWTRLAFRVLRRRPLDVAVAKVWHSCRQAITRCADGNYLAISDDANAGQAA